MPSGKLHLVVGATGTTGSQVVSALLRREERVRILCRSSERAYRLIEIGAEVVAGDLDEPTSLPSAFADVSSVFLVTSVNPRAATQAMNAIEAARSAGVQHLVRYSAAKASAESPSLSSRDHARVEDALSTTGLPFTIVRTHFFMQNLLHSATAIESDSAIYMPLKNGRLAMVDVRDVSEAVAKVLVDGSHLSETLTMTGPDSISISQAAAIVSSVIGREVRYIDVSLEETRQTLLAAGLDEYLVNEYIVYYRAFAEGLGDFISDDFERVTGRQPRSFAEFAADHAEEFGASRSVPAPQHAGRSD
jgi:uncharacterized protein YbjT (DUF2867 family)